MIGEFTVYITHRDPLRMWSISSKIASQLKMKEIGENNIINIETIEEDNRGTKGKFRVWYRK
jgi:hypothetical protein